MKNNIIKIFLLVVLLITSGCISKKNEDVKEKEVEKVSIDKVIEDLINYKNKGSRALVVQIVMPGIYVKNGVIYEYYSITKLEIMTFQERVKLYDSIESMPKDIYVVIENKIKDFLNYRTIDDLLNDGGNACEGIGVSTEIYNMENGQMVCSDGNTLKSILVEKAPTKLNYVLGEESMDLTGIVVKGTYIDGTKKTEEITMENITGFETKTSGLKNIVVDITGRKSAFVIRVEEKSLTNISLTNQPTKTTYYVGESSLDITGLVVIGTYNDGTTKTETITSSNISGFNTTTSGTKTVTVTVSGKTATFPITVVDVLLNSISIITQPTKTSYYVGDSLISLTGISVTGTYNNGTTKTETITNSNISGFNTATSGTKTITVTVSGKTATFPITVVAVTLNSISVTTQPTKTSYYAGDSTISLTGLVVTGTYNNGTTKTETITNSNISGFNTATSGTKTITVTVSGKTATFPITVVDAIRKLDFTLTKNIDILKLKQYSAIFEVADTSIKTLVLTGNGGVSPGQISLTSTTATVAKIVMDSSVTQIFVKALDINGNQVGEVKTVTLN
jgi:hypothetical protein